MKRLFLISFILILLYSYPAFCSLTVDDYKRMEVEGIEPTYNEITQDQTSYENWVLYVDSKTNSHYDLPSFSNIADLTEPLLSYAVGNYADVASGVLSNLEDYFSLGSDIWDYLTFNVQYMAFDYAPDFVELLKSGVDSEIYDEESSGGERVVGNWYSLPKTVNSSNYLIQYSGLDVYVCYVSGRGITLACRGLSDAYYQRFYNNSGMDPQNLAWYTRYNGSAYSGYYAGLGLTPNPMWDYYSDLNAALYDMFGQEWEPPSGESILNGNGIIVNDNPVINPVTLTSALGYPFKQTVINNYNNNTPIPWRPNNYNYVDYNYDYEVPFWEGQQLETLEYPVEIEFPTIEFETIEVDQSVDTALEGLNGSWIVEFFLVAILLLILGLIL